MDILFVCSFYFCFVSLYFYYSFITWNCRLGVRVNNSTPQRQSVTPRAETLTLIQISPFRCRILEGENKEGSCTSCNKVQ